MSFVYISYNPDDSDFARALRSQLEAEGYNTWMDELRQPDELLFDIMKNAIASAAAVIVAHKQRTAHSDMVWWEISCAQTSKTPILTVSTEAEIPDLFEPLAALLPKEDEHVTLPSPLSTDEILALQKTETRQNNFWLVIVVVVVVVGAALFLAQQFLFAPAAVIHPISPLQMDASELPPTLPIEMSLGVSSTEEVIEPSSTPLETSKLAPTATGTASTTHTAILTGTLSKTPTPTITWTATSTQTNTATATQRVSFVTNTPVSYLSPKRNLLQKEMHTVTKKRVSTVKQHPREYLKQRT